MTMEKDYRKMLVDDQDGWYTMIIQYHKSFPIKHWITIKTMESMDLDKLNTVADSILKLLETDVYQ